MFISLSTEGGSVDLNGLLQLISGRYQEMTTTAAELADSFQVSNNNSNNSTQGLILLTQCITDPQADGLCTKLCHMRLYTKQLIA